jgi:hypothetical protein
MLVHLHRHCLLLSKSRRIKRLVLNPVQRLKPSQQQQEQHRKHNRSRLQHSSSQLRGK